MRISLLLFIALLAGNLMAQERDVSRKWSVEIGVHPLFHSPVRDIKHLLWEHEYNKSVGHIFSSGSSQYPRVTVPAIPLELNLIKYNPHSANHWGLGVMQFSGEVSGYSQDYSRLKVVLQNWSVFPLYVYAPTDQFRLLVGPAIFFNKTQQTNSSPEGEYQGSQVSWGGLGGLSLALWKGRYLYGNLNTRVAYGSLFQVGPLYPSKTGDGQGIIPATDFRFYTVSIGISVGANIFNQ